MSELWFVYHSWQTLPSVSKCELLNIDRTQGLRLIQSHSEESKLRSVNSWQKWASCLPTVSISHGLDITTVSTRYERNEY